MAKDDCNDGDLPGKPDQYGDARMVYYIQDQLLTVKIGDTTREIHAYSGGGGGSTRNKPTKAGNHPAYTQLENVKGPHTQGHEHGGPLPLGCYGVQKPRFGSPGGGVQAWCMPLVPGPCVDLTARVWKDDKGVWVNEATKAAPRGGFLIHPRGPHGSDGCIVPSSNEIFNQLRDDLTKVAGKHAYAGRLRVVNWRILLPADNFIKK